MTDPDVQRTKKSKVDNAESTQRSATTSSGLLLDHSLMQAISKASNLEDIDFEQLMSAVTEKSRNYNGEKEPKDLDLADYFYLLENFAQQTGDETFRLSTRSLLPGALHFALSQAALAPTFEDAMRSVAQSFNMLHGGNYNHVTFRADTIIYSVNNDGFPYPFKLNQEQSDSLMECILVLMHTVFTLVTSTDLNTHLVKVCTKRGVSAPSQIFNHLTYWHVPVRLKNAAYSLVYDISAATMPVTLEGKTLPKRHAIYGLVGDLIREHTQPSKFNESFTSRVRTLLQRDIRTEHEAAIAMGVSLRTLRRRLQEEKASFRDLNQEILNERACALLLNDHPVSEVAEELGYSDERSFRRAFLRWNNKTPTTYKREFLNKQ